LITNEDNVGEIAIPATVDFHISLHGELGSILVVNGAKNENCVQFSMSVVENCGHDAC
jgi:hypothetical protein